MENVLGEVTSGLNSEGKCENVDKDNIFSAFLPTPERIPPPRNSLIRVDSLFATKDLLKKLLKVAYVSGTSAS